jgi:hypothetical protein
MKTKVFYDTFKNHRLFAVWEVDDSGNKIGDYPLVSLGYKKAKVLLEHDVQLKEFVDKSKEDEKSKKF